jgi:hypothetical protein
MGRWIRERVIRARMAGRSPEGMRQHVVGRERSQPECGAREPRSPWLFCVINACAVTAPPWASACGPASHKGETAGSVTKASVLDGICQESLGSLCHRSHQFIGRKGSAAERHGAADGGAARRGRYAAIRPIHRPIPTNSSVTALTDAVMLARQPAGPASLPTTPVRAKPAGTMYRLAETHQSHQSRQAQRLRHKMIGDQLKCATLVTLP